MSYDDTPPWDDSVIPANDAWVASIPAATAARQINAACTRERNRDARMTAHNARNAALKAEAQAARQARIDAHNARNEAARRAAQKMAGK